MIMTSKNISNLISKRAAVMRVRKDMKTALVNLRIPRAKHFPSSVKTAVHRGCQMPKPAKR